MNSKERRAAKRAAARAAAEGKDSTEIVKDHLISNFTDPYYVREVAVDEKGKFLLDSAGNYIPTNKPSPGWYYIGDVVMKQGVAMPHGKGVWYTPRREVYYRGDFKDGLRDGVGKQAGRRPCKWAKGLYAGPLYSVEDYSEASESDSAA